MPLSVRRRSKRAILTVKTKARMTIEFIVEDVKRTPEEGVHFNEIMKSLIQVVLSTASLLPGMKVHGRGQVAYETETPVTPGPKGSSS